MSQYSKVLHFQKNGNAVNVTVKDQYGESTPQIFFRRSGSSDVEVFTDPEDVTSSTDPLLSINDEAGTVYAELVPKTDENASDLIVSVNGTEYAAKKVSASGGSLSSDADFAFLVSTSDTVTATSSNTNVATVSVTDNLVEISLVDPSSAGVASIAITASNVTRYFLVSLIANSKFADGHKIYGFKIDKNDSNPATRVTYTDDAANLTPTSLNSDGTLNLGSWADTFVIKAFTFVTAIGYSVFISVMFVIKALLYPVLFYFYQFI